MTLIDETGCFQQPYIKASNRAFTVQTRYTRGVNKGSDRGETGRGQLVSAAAGLRCRPPHFVLTVCQCEPSACFTRGVRLLLIIITLCIGADRIRRYVSAVNGLSL